VEAVDGPGQLLIYPRSAVGGNCRTASATSGMMQGWQGGWHQFSSGRCTELLRQQAFSACGLTALVHGSAPMSAEGPVTPGHPGRADR